MKKDIRLIGLSSVFGGNFGDLIGPYLYKKMTGSEPEMFSVNKKSERDAIAQNHILAVGSILKHASKFSYLWGIGIMDKHDTKLISSKLNSENIFAVRGPKTIRHLKAAGLVGEGQSFAVGDPGLLLPLFYQPHLSAKKFSLGIIPHCTEYEEVKERYSNVSGVCVIELGNLERYENIERVIEELCCCEKIMSSSLHGILVAHAYHIPAAWCNFTNITASGSKGTGALKFQDYFDSVELRDIEATRIEKQDINESGFSLPDKELVQQIQANLLSVCPFNFDGLTIEQLKAANHSS